MRIYQTLRPRGQRLHRAAMANQMLLRGVFRRSICMDRVIRGVRDGLAVASGLGETFVGRPIASMLRRELVSAARRFHDSRIAEFKSSTPIEWHIAAAAAPTTDLTTRTTPSEHMRSVMRLLAQSVVVCTVTHGSTPRAMTMSSFTSLTLSPTPVITFNVATPSRTLDAIAESREFNIHVLAGDADGARVADHFTKGNMSDNVFEGLEAVECVMGSSKAAPLLVGAGVVHVLKCKVLDDAPERGLIRVRDHVIVAAEVVETAPGEDTREFGLAYADRKYRQIGAVIERD